jgi:ADP-heptose:LPS heptosyltransferase
MTQRPTLLALRALGLGDFLTAVPAYRALARAFPGHHRVLAAPKALAPLAALAGGIDEIADAAPLAGLPRSLHGADVAVNLHGSGPQSHEILMQARPHRLIAFARPGVPASSGGPAWRRAEHEVVRWCRLLSAYGIVADPRDLRLDAPDVPVPRRFAGVTVVHPGAASGARRWPVDRWAAVVRALEAEGHRVVVTGGRDEVGLAAELALRAGLPRRRCLAGRTTLMQLAAVVARCRLLLSADTGVAHLANAYDRPSVVLFGPTAPTRWGPLDGDRHRVLWAGTEGDPHGLRADPGLLRIGADAVIAQAQALCRDGEQHGNRTVAEAHPGRAGLGAGAGGSSAA